MLEQSVFEYAVVRVVPRVEREEFFNAGVIVYCKQQKFLQTKIEFDVERLCAFPRPVDSTLIKNYLDAFENICAGKAAGSPIAQLDPASRFRWLTAARSTLVQTSRIHPGLCTDPLQTLNRLFEELVH